MTDPWTVHSGRLDTWCHSSRQRPSATRGHPISQAFAVLTCSADDRPVAAVRADSLVDLVSDHDRSLPTRFMCRVRLALRPARLPTPPMWAAVKVCARTRWQVFRCYRRVAAGQAKHQTTDFTAVRPASRPCWLNTDAGTAAPGCRPRRGPRREGSHPSIPATSPTRQCSRTTESTPTRSTRQATYSPRGPTSPGSNDRPSTVDSQTSVCADQPVACMPI